VDHDPDQKLTLRKSKASTKQDGILIVGMDKLLTQLAGCCKPAPGDEIQGYITQGKGISIHRRQCANFIGMVRQNPERAIEADWGNTPKTAVYAVDIVVECANRAGLIGDIMEVMTQESINVTAAKTLSRQETARLNFTLEVSDTKQLQRALQLINNIPFVQNVRRT
jgi:GTP pyrophosphokinase